MIETRTSNAICWMKIDGIVQELYYLAVIMPSHRPMAFGLQIDQVRCAIRFGEGVVI